MAGYSVGGWLVVEWVDDCRVGGWLVVGWVGCWL